MQLTVKHVTRYDYDEPVGYALQKVRLRPKTTELQDIETWDLTIEGGRVEASYTDHYGNHVDLVSAEQGARHLIVSASGRAQTHDKAGILGKVYGCAPLWHFREQTEITRPGPKIRRLAETVEKSGNTLDGLHALSAEILSRVSYKTGQTDVMTAAEGAAELGQGVCQDHANIFVSAARIAGLPARYVSGYLLMPDRVDQDASHGWAEAHLPDLGWVGFDVSNGVSPDEKYLRIATGRDARDATPISGLRMGSGDETMIVSLQVQQ